MQSPLDPGSAAHEKAASILRICADRRDRSPPEGRSQIHGSRGLKPAAGRQNRRRGWYRVAEGFRAGKTPPNPPLNLRPGTIAPEKNCKFLTYSSPSEPIKKPTPAP